MLKPNQAPAGPDTKKITANKSEQKRWDSLRGGKGAIRNEPEGPDEPIEKLGNISNKISSVAKKASSSPQLMKGGSDAGSMGREIQNTVVATAMDADILIMLPIAVVCDIIGFVFFILSLIGIGIMLQEFIDIPATIFFGLWVIIRSFLQGIVLKALNSIEDMVAKMGKSDKSQQSSYGSPSGSGSGKSGVIKKGTSMFAKIAWALVLGIIELIPFIGSLIPAYTIMVLMQTNILRRAKNKFQ